MFSWNALLPSNWKAKYLPIWLDEDLNGLDISSAVIGDNLGQAELMYKSDEMVKTEN